MKTTLLRILDHRRSAGTMTLATLLNAMTVLSGIGLMATSAWLLATAALHPSIAVLEVAIVGVRFFGILRAALRYLERLVSHNAALLMMALLRLRVFRSLVPLAPARLYEARSGDVLARLVDDVGSLEGFFVRVVGPTLAAGIVILIVAGGLWIWQPILGLAALVCVTLTAVIAGGAAWHGACGAVTRAARTRGALGAAIVDSLQGMAEILAFGGEQTQWARVVQLDDALVRDQTRVARAATMGSVLATVGADLTVAGALGLSIAAARRGLLDGVQIAVVALLILAAFEAVAAMPAAGQAAAAASAAARRLFDVLDAEPAIVEPATSVAPAHAPGAVVMEARHLTFAYPGEPQPALRDLSLRLGHGKRMALVGPSGSGKTTLLHLALRFWDAPAGALFLEGQDVRTWPSDAARAHIAYADQGAPLLTGTLRENLTLSNPGVALRDLDRVLAALRLDDLVSRMGRGLDTWVGEQGHHLSGGERRRIALARALLRPAPLLLLDEPTAHLDSETERDVMAALVEAGQRRATLIVTHRLSGLEAFDEIIVLDDGAVAERGRVSELTASGGAFARMQAVRRSLEAVGDRVFGTDPVARRSAL